MSVSNALNPNVVKTYLDGLFFPEWDGNTLPEIATADDGYIFMQESSDKSQETIEEFTGSGAWEARGEFQDAPEGQPQSLYTYTFTNAELAKGVSISGRFFDDDQHNMVSMIMRDFASKGLATKNSNAFAVYRNAFSAASPIGDAVALCSASHPIQGGTQSNTMTTKLNETSLNTAIVALAEQKERDGVVLGRMPHCLLVPTAHYKNAAIILDSELRAATANNDANIYSSKYGIFLKTTPYLGTAAGGSDDYWFLLAKNHPVMRYLRQDIKTTMIDRSQTKNDAYFYRGMFRQSTGAASYVGIYGSSGTTGSYDA